jgi:hypothetical protein
MKRDDPFYVKVGMWREIMGFGVVSRQLCLLVINELQTG